MNNALYIKEGVNSVLKGETKFLLDKQIIQSLPATIENLFSKKKEKIAEDLIEKLGENFFSDNLEIKKNIYFVFSNISKIIMSSKHLDTASKISLKLANWLITEQNEDPVFQELISKLQEFAQFLIQERNFSDSGFILEVFDILGLKKNGKTLAIQQKAALALKNLTTEETLKILAEAFESKKEDSSSEALNNLIKLGKGSVSYLLNILLRSEDMNQRFQVLRAISDIGEVATDLVIEKLKEENPWYYVRNLILLVGKIGDVKCLNILKPFLFHSDLRVQRETLFSMSKISKEHSEEIIVSILPSVSDNFKINIIGLLGNMRSIKSVPVIFNLFKSINSSNSEIKEQLLEKIIAALGDVGNSESIDILTEIATSNAYNEQLKSLAVSNLESIKV